MDNKIATLIAISVTVILAGSLLVPVIISANEDAQIVKTNSGNYADVLENTADANLNLAYSSDGTYTVNGETQTISGFGALLISDLFRIGYNGASIYWAYWDGSTIRFGTSGITNLTLSVVDGVLTLNFGDDTDRVFEWSKVAYLTNDVTDNYTISLIASGATPFYVNSLDQIIAAQLVSSNSGYASYIGGVLTSKGVTATENIGYTSVYRAEDMISVSGGPNGSINVSVDGVDSPLTYVCVPKVVTSDTVTSDAMALLYAAPLLVFAALIVVAVGLFMRKY